MRDPFPIVAMLGRRLEGERTGWRDMKGLVLMVAQAGPPEEAWPIAADLAAALGLDEQQQENIYANAYGGERPATTTERGASHAERPRVHDTGDDLPGHPPAERKDAVPAYPGFH